MARATPTRGSDQQRAAAANDREHSSPSSSTERAKAINAARLGQSYSTSLQAKQIAPIDFTTPSSARAAATTLPRPPVTNKTLPDMTWQMSSRHQLPNGRSKTGWNTLAEVEEAKKSAFRQFPDKAHARELGAREERGVEKIDTANAYQGRQEGVMEENAAVERALEVPAEGQKGENGVDKGEGKAEDSEYDDEA